MNSMLHVWLWWLILTAPVWLAMLWLSAGRRLRHPRWQGVLRIRILAFIGAMAIDGPEAAVAAWRDVEMADEAFRRGV